MDINGKTKLFALIGHPVEHSFSPGLHNPQLKLNDINGRYLAFDVEPENLGKAIEGLFVLGVQGANITVPFKEKVIPFLSGISQEAKLIGAVNTLVRSDQGFYGENTDGRGFVKSLKVEKNFDVKNKKIVILGAGGAARGISVALAFSGCKEISFINRTLEKGKILSDIIENNTNIVSNALDYSFGEEINRKISEADLVINSTNIGMFPRVKEKPVIDYNYLHKKQLIADLIYNPDKTLFLKEAESRGAEILNGKGMLYYQGELAFNLWTGKNFK